MSETEEKALNKTSGVAYLGDDGVQTGGAPSVVSQVAMELKHPSKWKEEELNRVVRLKAGEPDEGLTRAALDGNGSGRSADGSDRECPEEQC